MKALVDTRLSDPTTERMRDSHAEAIRELQDLPASSIRIIRNVILPDAVEIAVPHKLGREIQYVKESCVRGANTGGVVRDFGVVSPVTGARIDRTKIVMLRADGYGATITVDLLVA